MKNILIALLLLTTTACTPAYLRSESPVPVQLQCPDFNYNAPDIVVTVDIPSDLCDGIDPVQLPPVTKHIKCDLEYIDKILVEYIKVVKHMKDATASKNQKETLEVGMSWFKVSGNLIGSLRLEYAECEQ